MGVVASTIIGALASGIVGAISQAAPQIAWAWIQSDTDGYATRIRQVVRRLSNLVAKDSDLLNKLTEAYQRRDNGYMTALLQTAGFGPQVEAIRKAASDARAQFLNTKDSIEKRDRELNNEANRLEVDATGYSRTSIIDRSKAEKQAKEAEDKIESIEQNINGGIKADYAKIQ